MLGLEHAFLKRGGVVACDDRDFAAAQNLTGIEFLGHKVHRTPMDLVAGIKGPLMGVEAAIFGKEGWVNV